MRPSAKELIDSIDWSLQTRVVPVTDDKWAASTLRSVHCLLLHLSARVEAEGKLLHEDNADLRGVLADLRQLLGSSRAASACSDLLDRALARRWRDPAEYPSVASLNEENEALRAALDSTLVAVHGGGAGLDADQERVALAHVDGYLSRRVGREQPLFMPAFLASNF